MQGREKEAIISSAPVVTQHNALPKQATHTRGPPMVPGPREGSHRDFSREVQSQGRRRLPERRPADERGGDAPLVQLCSSKLLQ